MGCIHLMRKRNTQPEVIRMGSYLFMVLASGEVWVRHNVLANNKVCIILSRNELGGIFNLVKLYLVISTSGPSTAS